MPLTYDQDSRLRALSPVLDEHGAWFARVIRQIFYPDTTISFASPESFTRWAEAAERDDAIEKEVLVQLRQLHGDLIQMAAYLFNAAVSGSEKPDIKQFDTLTTLYEEFIAHIRRMERDLAASEGGLDPLTGLRTRQVMVQDVERELERRSRHGKPFCLALARVDRYAEIKAELTPQEHDALMVAAANIIKKCIRSFDDAYILRDGEYLMSLKQTELSGGSASLNRLKKLLEEGAPSFVVGGKQIRLTMSSCVAEPQPGDQTEDLITLMRADLNRYGGNSETAVEYFEVSPLERFVKTLDESSEKTPH